MPVNEVIRPMQTMLSEGLHEVMARITNALKYQVRYTVPIQHTVFVHLRPLTLQSSFDYSNSTPEKQFIITKVDGKWLLYKTADRFQDEQHSKIASADSFAGLEQPFLDYMESYQL